MDNKKNQVVPEEATESSLDQSTGSENDEFSSLSGYVFSKSDSETVTEQTESATTNNEEQSTEESEMIPHIEHHKDGGKYIKSIIFGGLDGIVSVFVTVAATSGTSQTAVLVLILGIAKLIAGAISMGVGDWLSTGAEVTMAKRERRREEWETDNYIEGEIAEMVELYIKKGVPRENAVKIMNILSKNKQAFVDVMMAEELGITADIVDEVPYKHGLVNFTSFLFFGSVPLIAYVVVVAAQIQGMIVFYVSIAMTVATLVLMGFIKGKMTGSTLWKSVLITTLLGAFTAFVGWFVSWILNRSFPGVNISG